MTHEINIADFAAFCRSKGEETFDVWDHSNCAIAQWGRTVFPDRADDVLGGLVAIYVVNKGEDDRHVIPGLGTCDVVASSGGSFSILAERLEALAEQSDA